MTYLKDAREVYDTIGKALLEAQGRDDLVNAG